MINVSTDSFLCIEFSLCLWDLPSRASRGKTQVNIYYRLMFQIKTFAKRTKNSLLCFQFWKQQQIHYLFGMLFYVNDQFFPISVWDISFNSHETFSSNTFTEQYKAIALFLLLQKMGLCLKNELHCCSSKLIVLCQLNYSALKLDTKLDLANYY